jgi:murein L,D-transpeptidase YcbB/YkuD
MAKIRQAIFSDCAISDLSFLKDYERHPQYMNDHQDFVEADMSLHGDRSDQESALTSRDDMVLGISHSHLMGGVEHLPIVAEALETLGYCSRSPGILHTAVVQFQKCAGLTVDGVPGSDTCLAIKNRLNGLGLNVPAGILV